MNSSDNFQVHGWTEKFRTLHDFVCQARVSSSDLIVNRLNYNLQLHKQDILNLLDDPPKNAQDRTTVQGGKAYINKSPHKVNQEFIDETLLLSDQLGINEHVAATLLMEAITRKGRGNTNRVDTAVILYHNERLYLLACLDVILKLAKEAEEAKETNVGGPVQSVCMQFMAELLATNIPSVGSFAAKIIRTIKKLDETIASLSTTGTINADIQQQQQQQQQQQITMTTTTLSSTSTVSAGRLGEDIQKTRMDLLEDERIYLIQILYHMASLFWLEQQDVFDIANMLEDADLTQVTTPYLLIALISALSVKNHMENTTQPNNLLYNDRDFLVKFQQHLDEKTWRVKAAKGLVTLQWVTSLFNIAQMDRTFESILPTTEEKLDELVDNAVSNRVFNFINDYLLYFQQPTCDYESHGKIFKWSVYAERMVEPNLTVEASDFDKFNADIRPEFQPFVIYEIELFATEFIDKLTGTLRKLKYREEDTSAAAATATTTTTTTTTTVQASSIALESDQEQQQQPRQCRDLEAFFDTLASIYRNRINAGGNFWVQVDNRLSGFRKWATDIKVSGTMRACYNFFASIATGDVCADHAFYFFDEETNKTDLNLSPVFSWGKLAAALQFYTQLLATATTEVAIPSAEEDVLIAFLGFLRQVVQYSATARARLWAAPPYRFSHCIFQMLRCSVSFELGAALYNVLAAFCSPRGVHVEHIAREISVEAWSAFQDLEYLVVRRDARRQQSLQQQQQLQIAGELQNQQLLNRSEDTESGLVNEFNMERRFKSYNKTLAVLNFMSSVIHVQSKVDKLYSGFTPVLQVIPWYLNKHTRRPGAEPYISVILDHIFLSLDSQDYTSSESKWQLTEACLKVMENSVESFDMQTLQEIIGSQESTTDNPARFASSWQGQANGSGANAVSTSKLQETLLLYVTHPGFTVISHMLSGKPVVNEMLKIIERGPQAIKGNAEKSPYFVRSLIRCLRIIYRVLSVQDAFANLLLPQIRAVSISTSTSEYKLGDLVFPPLPSLVAFGQLMLNRANSIVQLALLVNCEEQMEICFLSAKILHALSAETYESRIIKTGRMIQEPMGGLGSKLTRVLRSCKEELNVLLGFNERLEINDFEQTTADDYEYDINNIPFWQAKRTISREASQETDFVSAPLLTSVRLAIVEMLLDNSSLQKPSPSLSDYLLGYDRLSWGTGISSGTDRRGEEAFMDCFKTIIGLLRKGIPVDERDRDQTAAHELPLIATHPILAEKCYQLVYNLCRREATSSTTLRYLESKEDFFYRQFKALSPRLENYAQVGAPTFAGTVSSADGTEITMDFYALLSQLRQRTWLLQSIAIELHVMVGKRRTAQVRRLLKLLYGREHSNDENIDSNSNDRNGSADDMEIDGNILSSTNNAYFEQPLVKMLELVSSLEFTWRDELVQFESLSEPKYFKVDRKRYQIRNERDCIVYDIRAVYRDLRAEERTKRAAGAIHDPAAAEKEMGEILCRLMAENHQQEIANARLSCLQAWKQVVQVTLSECFDLFPFQVREKIIYGLLSTLLPKMKSAEAADADILQGLGEVILSLLARLREDKAHQDILQVSPNVNVSTSRLPDENLRTIFYGILDCIQGDGANVAVRGNMYTTLVNLMHYCQSDPNSDIQNHFVNIMGANDKFLDILCTDASDGLNVWKTTAYITLDCLYKISKKAGNPAILRFLVKNNFLRCSIDIIRREDAEIMALLTQTDTSLTPLDIFEAKMSLLLSLALSREGAKLLLENRIIDVLSHCQSINSRPEPPSLVSQDALDSANLLTERYNRVLLPTLKLISALLCSLGRANGVMVEKVEGWARKQQEALLHILKDDLRHPSLSSLQHLRLATTIIYHLSNRNGFFDDMAARGLSQIHKAMMHLIEKYLNVQTVSKQVVPLNDKEKQWASKMQIGTVGNSRRSLLEGKAEELVVSIQMNLAAYAQNASFVLDQQGNSSFRPVFTNVLNVDQYRRMVQYRNVSLRTPSLSTLVVCIQNIAKNLQSSIAEYKVLLPTSENIPALKLDEIRAIADAAFPRSLNIQHDHLDQVLLPSSDSINSLKLDEIQAVAEAAFPRSLNIQFDHLDQLLLPSSVNTDLLKLDEIRAIAEEAFPPSLNIQFDHLNHSQQQQLLTAEIRKHAVSKVKHIRHLFFIIENALLILWRHLEYYSGNQKLEFATSPFF